MTRNINIDDTVFFHIGANVHEGIVAKTKDEFGFYEIEDLTVVQFLKLHAKEIYLNEQEAIEAMHRKNIDAIESYERQIFDVPTLITFMLNHNVSLEGETNWEARFAVNNKLKAIAI